MKEKDGFFSFLYDRGSKKLILSEMFFVFLPIIIVVLVKALNGDFLAILTSSEWSIGALILFGQSIVKFSSGISNRKEKSVYQQVALFLTLIIVLGLVPSIIFLTYGILDKLSLCLYILQGFWFVIACVVFFVFGTAGVEFLENIEENKKFEKTKK